MVRYLIVTARNRSDLYAYLRRQFSPDEKVQVLLDRRREERRHRQALKEPERRRGDRRSQPSKDNWLHYYGLLIVRQSPEAGRQPFRSGPDTPEDLVKFDRPWRGEGTQATKARERLIGWVTEGQRLFSVVPRLFQEHGNLTARVETAERKCERLEQEIKSLRNENEYFRKERGQTANSLQALARELLESAGEEL